MAVGPRSTAPTRSTPALAQALVGAWRLESTVQRLTDGTVRGPAGGRLPEMAASLTGLDARQPSKIAS